MAKIDPDGLVRLDLNNPVFQETGQSVVFYDGEVCLGGGVIESKTNTD